MRKGLSIFLILVVSIFLHAKAQQLSLYNQTHYFPVFDFTNDEYDDQFITKHPLCCTPPNLTVINSTSAVLQLNGGGTINSYSLNFNGHQVDVESKIASDAKSVTINFSCYGDQLGSGLMENKLTVIEGQNSQDLAFQFWYRCGDVGFTPLNFDWSNLILIIITCITILIMARYSKIISFKVPVSSTNKWFVGSDHQMLDDHLAFQGVKVTGWYIIIYLVTAAIFYLIILGVGPQRSFTFNLAVTSILALILGAIFIDELLCYLSANFRLQTSIYKSIRVCDVLSFVISGGLIAAYILTGQPWILSDVFSFLIVGSVLKLFKVTSFRDGSIFLILCLSYDLIYSLVINLKIKANYQQFVLEFANFPLLLEIPTIKDTLMIKCSWLSIEDIILPGLLICYLYRYDTNNNSRVYTSIGVSALFLGILTWIISSVAASRAQISLPQSMFVFTFIIVGTVLWAYKQGDLKSLWMGHFYDKAILEPISIQQHTRGSLLSETELDPQIFKGLNSSSTNL